MARNSLSEFIFFKKNMGSGFCKMAPCPNFLIAGVDGPQNSLLCPHHPVSDVNEPLRKVRGDELMCNIMFLVAQEVFKTKRINYF